MRDGNVRSDPGSDRLGGQHHVLTCAAVGQMQADYTNVGITVKCAGLMTVTPKAPKAEQKALGSKPLISDEEMQEQYRQLYSEAKVERAAIEQHANKVCMCARAPVLASHCNGPDESWGEQHALIACWPAIRVPSSTTMVANAWPILRSAAVPIIRSTAWPLPCRCCCQGQWCWASRRSSSPCCA